MTFKVTLNHLCIIERLSGYLTFELSDLITIFTYVLMDNFCPCFYYILGKCKNYNKKGSMWNMRKINILMSQNELRIISSPILKSLTKKFKL